MVGKSGLEVREEGSPHVLLVGEGRRRGCRAGGDHRVLSPAGKEGQTDGHAGRNHVAIAIGPALVGDVEPPVGPFVGARDGNVCVGLGHAGMGGSEIGMSSYTCPEGGAIDGESGNVAGGLGRGLAGPA